jgi:hypothetical protein
MKLIKVANEDFGWEEAPNKIDRVVMDIMQYGKKYNEHVEDPNPLQYEEEGFYGDEELTDDVYRILQNYRPDINHRELLETSGQIVYYLCENMGMFAASPDIVLRALERNDII